MGRMSVFSMFHCRQTCSLLGLSLHLNILPHHPILPIPILLDPFPSPSNPLCQLMLVGGSLAACWGMQSCSVFPTSSVHLWKLRCNCHKAASTIATQVMSAAVMGIELDHAYKPAIRIHSNYTGGQSCQNWPP